MVIDAGISDYYDAFTNGWKAGWLVHWTRRDYAGNERVFGASIDVGCCEWFADDLTMYVDADNGNDDNAGLSESQPKRTLAAAVEAAAYSRLGSRRLAGRTESPLATRWLRLAWCLASCSAWR